MKKFKVYLKFLPPLVWMAVIFFWSSQPKVAFSGNYWVSFAFFKTLHIIEYGILFVLWRFAFGKKNTAGRDAAIIAILYGVSDEIHQGFIPGRESRIRDIAIDAIGVIIFWKIILSKVEIIISNSKLLKRVFFVFFDG